MKPCRFLAILFAAAMFSILSGCAADSPEESRDSSLDPKGAPLRHQEVTAGFFRLTIYSRIVDTNQPINVYVDGDTRGLAPSGGPNVDPAPDDYLTLRLAEMDPSDNVVFISRPCQFDMKDIFCTEKLPQNTRYAELMYTSMNRALNFALAKVPHPHLNLVGYSGGGAIAAVFAARRHDVDTLRTIAGNLDPNGNGIEHGSAPQNDFIDPVEIAPKLALVPQEHFVGTSDTFITPEQTENFVQTIGLSYCVKVTQIPGATHKAGWEEAWKNNVTRIPNCGNFASR